MTFSYALTAALLQAAAVPDTIVTRMIPQRDWFDWTSGILQIIVLLLGVGMLIALILLALSVRAAVGKVNDAVVKLSAETKPLIERATSIVEDTREVVAMVRTDVERLTDAAGAVSEQLIDAADVTSQRIDEVNAVLDVLQAELEGAAIGTVSAIRGVRVGARTLSDNLRNPSRIASGMAAADDDERFDDLDDADDLDDIALDEEHTPA